MNTRKGKGSEGFTLAELLIASVLGAVLLLALSAATGGVFDSMDTGLGEMNRSRDAGRALEVMAAAVRQAEDAAASGGYGLLLTDPSGHTTLYDWSGTPGDPLTVQEDGGAVLPLVEGVRNFSFTVNTETVTEEGTASSSEELLNFDHYPASYGEDWRWMRLEPGNVFGIAFTVPADTPVERITLTRVQVRIGAKKDDYGGLRISLKEARTMDHPYPVGDVVASKDYPWWEIPLVDWYYLSFEEFDLDASFEVLPNRPYLLLFECADSDPTGWLRMRECDTEPGPDNGIRAVVSDDGGATWEPDPGSPELDTWDYPVILDGAVVTTVENTVTKKRSVNLVLAVVRGGHTLVLERKARLLGGGE